jgi:hypothetical protein
MKNNRPEGRIDVPVDRHAIRLGMDIPRLDGYFSHPKSLVVHKIRSLGRGWMCFSANDANDMDGDANDLAAFKAIIFKCTSMENIQFVSLQANDPQDLPLTVSR